MDPKRILMLVLALAVAGGTVMFLKSYLGAERAAAERLATSRPATSEAVKPALQVLVARTDIRTGQIVKPDDLRWQPWPEGTLSPSYIVEGRRPLSDFVGAVARAPVSAGEPITEGRVVLPGTRGFMAAVLQPGTRAVSVPVTATSGISGFVFAGDRVDLLLTHTITPSKDGEKERYASETILSDIRVIAMDQRLESRPGEPPQIAKTATLEVTPKQSEIITLAQDMGKLSLSLRSLQEPEGEKQEERTFTRDNEVSQLLGAKEGSRGPTPVIAAPAGPSAPPPPVQGEGAVTIIRGAAASAGAAPQGAGASIPGMGGSPIVGVKP
ncbi:MAG: Flp pilus assembly protein CpaB [Rhodospirillales bacterium]|nr:MAG: Flp pilus assembly protein CpaB [Rhodospirillales bacterium]